MENAKVNRFSGLFEEGEDKSSKAIKNEKSESQNITENQKDKNHDKEIPKQYSNSNKGNEGRIYKEKQGGYRKKDNPYSKGRIEYVAKDVSGQNQKTHYKYEGSNDPIHPYDRKSGTGRGKEDPKEGHKGWGKFKDDFKELENEHNVKEKQVENLENQKEEEDKQNEKAPKNESEENKNLNKEEKEEVKKPEIPPIMYSEYLKQKEEKRKNLPQQKIKPKKEQKFQGLQEVNEPELVDKKAIKNYKPPEEFFAQKVFEKIELGTYIESDKHYAEKQRRPFIKGNNRQRDNQKESKFDKKPEESKSLQDKSKEKKFVLNEQDFPPL